jgi:hypothetical protein
MAPDDVASTRALRLILTYRGGDVSLEDVVFVAKRLPPSDELPEGGQEGELSGFWYELRDRAGEVLYRQIIGSPIIDAWVEPAEESRSEGSVWRRIAAVPDAKTFALLVPDLSNGDSVVLFSSPLDDTGVARPAAPLWRIQLPVRERE